MKKNNLLNHIQTLYKTNKLFQSIIIDSKDQNESVELLTEFIRFIFCDSNSIKNDNCNNCKRALNKNIVDVIWVGDGVTAIDKEEVQKIIQKMSITAFEKQQIKIYVIQNAENLKTSASNSLLKFLEEPPTNTFAFLLSKDRSSILQTIKSRCKVFVLEQDDKEFEYNIFEKIILTKDKNKYLLASEKFKKMDKLEFLKMLEESYNRTLVKMFPSFCELTLELINDLRYLTIDKIAIDNYFIRISEEI